MIRTSNEYRKIAEDILKTSDRMNEKKEKKTSKKKKKKK